MGGAPEEGSHNQSQGGGRALQAETTKNGWGRERTVYFG
jgi:hypothetical protein